jgi:ATP-dependent DNA ligase
LGRNVGIAIELYSGNGSRFSRRFPRLVCVLREIPARSAIIDGEIVANNAGLFLRSAKLAQLHIWAFDLLALNRRTGSPHPICYSPHTIYLRALHHHHRQIRS